MTSTTEPATDPREVPILYRDDRFVAVDKPGGLLVHRSTESSDRIALLQIVRDQIDAYVHPIHRLDRAASGVVLFALDPEAAAAAQAALARPDTRKLYLALVRGSTEASFESRRPLHAASGKPREARTGFRRLGEMSGCTLLEVRIHSGRRHQIRRHLSHLAHQVIGDSRYGKGRINGFLRERYGLPRLFLHSRLLEFENPLSDGTIRIESPLACDLRDFLRRLPDTPAHLLA